MRNVGRKDALVRYALAGVALGLGYALGPVSTVSTGLYVTALVLVFSAAVGFCGLYKLVGINTCPLDKR
jgi:hypothetical protein